MRTPKNAYFRSFADPRQNPDPGVPPLHGLALVCTPAPQVVEHPVH